MVKKFTCSFCGTDVEPGTGSIYVKNDGSLFYLCSSKCRRSQILLKRTPRRLKWTEVYEERLRRRAQIAKKMKKGKTKSPTKKEAKSTEKQKAPKTQPKASSPKSKSKSKSKKK